MSIDFPCRVCDKTLRVPDASVGKSCKCPACDSVSTIPIPDAGTELVEAKLVEAEDLDSETDVEELQMIAIPCPKCRHESMCDETLFDTKGQCQNCGHIFLITDDPVKRVLAEKSAPTRFVFKCPSCSQLFEGKKSMHGAAGRCTSCEHVFEIRLKKAKKSTPKLPPRKKKKRAIPPILSREQNSLTADHRQNASANNSANSSRSQRQELELVEEVEVVEAVDAVDEPAGASMEVPTPAPSPYTQMACGSCSNVMSVENTTPVGTVVACPHCRNEVAVPDLGNGMQRPPSASFSPSMPPSLPIQASTGVDLSSAFGSTPPATTFDRARSYASSGGHRKAKRNIRGLSFQNAWNLFFLNLFPNVLVASVVVVLCAALFFGFAFVVMKTGFYLALTLRLGPTSAKLFALLIALVLLVGHTCVGAASSCSICSGILATMRGDPDATSHFFKIGSGFGGTLGFLALQYGVGFLFGMLFQYMIVSGVIAGNTIFVTQICVSSLAILVLLTQIYVPFALVDGYSLFDAIGYSLSITFTRPVGFVFILIITLLSLLAWSATFGLLLLVGCAMPVFAAGAVYHLESTQ